MARFNFKQTLSNLSYASSSNKLILSGSLDATGSVNITGSLNVSGTANLTASWAQNVPASGVAGLSLNQIASGSVSASINTNSASFQITSGSSTLLFVSNSGALTLNYPQGGSGNSHSSINIQDSNLVFSGGKNTLTWTLDAATGRTSGISVFYLGNNGYEQGMSFSTATGGVGLGEVFRITNLKNLLIGTTSDTGYRLNISGAGTSGSFNANNTLYVSGSNVGIATTASSGYVLDINGNTRLQGVLSTTNYVGIGAQTADVSLRLGLSGFNVGIQETNPISSNDYRSFETYNSVSASATVGSMIGFRVRQNSLGAGATVTTQTGFKVEALTFGSIIYGFRSSVASASGKWNLYMDGTANNFLSGSLLIGDSTTDSGYKLLISGSGVSGSLNVNNVLYVSGSNVGIGTTGSAPQAQLNINQVTGTTKGLFISGDEIYATGNGATNKGIRIALGVSRASNRQLWMGDADAFGSSTLSIFRYQTGIAGYAGLDAVTGDGLTRLLTLVGTDTSNVGIGYDAQTPTSVSYTAKLNAFTYNTSITNLLLKKFGTATGSFIELVNSSGTQLVTIVNTGNLLLGPTTDTGYKIHVSGSGASGSLNVNNVLIVSGSSVQVTGSLDVSGSGRYSSGLNITGSFVVSGSSPTITGNLTVQNSNVVTLTISDTQNARSFQFYKNAGSGYIIENNSANKISYGYSGNYFMSWYCVSKSIAISSTASEPAADSTAIFDLQSTTKGFLAPRMTAVQRTGIINPAQGLRVYDTGTGTEGIWYYDSGSLKAWTRVLNDSGSQIITGSLNVTTAVSASRLLVSGSGVSQVTVIGSGSSSPLFTVVGSQGELFSVNDTLSGSLFSVNDISGLPVLEAFSDNRVLLGSYQAPAVYTTVKVNSIAGNNVIYQNLSTASYDGMFISYTARSGSNGRVGQITGMWSASAMIFNEFATSSFGDTTGLAFTMFITGSNMAVTASTTTANWSIKTIVRSI